MDLIHPDIPMFVPYLSRVIQSYRLYRTMSECVFESLPQSILQVYIFLRQRNKEAKMVSPTNLSISLAASVTNLLWKVAMLYYGASQYRMR